MFQPNFANDAANCRLQAQEFEGRPEKAFLLRLASEFEHLAGEATRPLRSHDSDLSYFAQRASQEVTAAVMARHPIARLAHLKMAQRYDALTLDSERRGSSPVNAETNRFDGS